MQIGNFAADHYPVIARNATAKTIVLVGGSITIAAGSLTIFGPAKSYNGFTTLFYVFDGSVDNNGILNVSINSSTAGKRSLWTNTGSSFTNLISGSINIGGSQDLGLVRFGSFINDGHIDIGASTSPNMKTGLQHQGANFTNRALGTIKVNRSTEVAVRVSGGQFSNIGSLDIGDVQMIHGDRNLFRPSHSRATSTK